MKISFVKVHNYRNLDGIAVNFNPECNYIIGENNLGKSNFLSLLATVCNGRAFDEKDFADSKKPIEVELEVRLLHSELGFFGDNFSPADESLVRILYRQAIEEAYAAIVCPDSRESIPSKQLKKINFLRYDTTSVLSKELRLDTRRGAGLLMNSIIERFIGDSAEASAFLNNNQVGSLTEFINDHLDKISSFRDYAIKAIIAPNPTEMLTSLFYLSDGDRRIDETGSGVQYMAMASINIICQIMELYRSRSSPFEEHIYRDEDNKLLLPLVLSIDEPEVHLHPYLQRSLIGYYKRILRNEDNEFVELLNKCFGIDGIDGQLIVVTHSTDALVGDYRNLIRFYKNGNKIAVISAASSEFQLTSVNEKHLIMHFPEIKESFYAHCAILIEGETEYGCMHSFADKIGVSLDYYGICVVNARGEGSIKPLRQLLGAFSIPSIAIYDGDVKDGHTATADEFFTKEICFEVEIVKHLYEQSNAALVRQIALELDKNGEQITLDANFVRKPFNKMGINMTGYVPKKLLDVSDTDKDDFCRMYSAWFMVKKGVLLGRIIGEVLPVELIPKCYVDAIIRAKEVAINGLS